MIKKVVIGTAALMLAASAYAYAQQPSGGRDGAGRFQLRAEDRAAFLDARLAALHAGLKLTPDQEKSWPGFEEAFLEFNPKRLLFQPAEFWEKLANDKRIVRHAGKIKAVRDNAKFVTEIAHEHGSFGKFLSRWPADDQVGLMEVLGKRGARLGGFSGQYFLRFLGWDAFVLQNDVLMCLRDSGVEIGAGTSKKDLLAVQAQLNAWAGESGLPIAHVSRICALSIGENHAVARLKEIMQT